MPTSLPPSSDFTGAGVTEGGFKSAITALRDYLAGLFGTDGAAATALATLGAPLSSYVAKTTTYAVVAGDKGKVFDCTGTWSMSALAAATAGDGFNFGIRNSGTGVITFDPNLTETIDGGTTLAINAGESLFIYGNGTGWVSMGKSSGIPSGFYGAYGGGTVPAGWLLCDGSAVSRTTYASLFTAIGTTHGVGDGSSTFNLPDARGRTIAGKDNMGGSAASRLTTAGSGVDGATLGASGGAQNVTLSAAESGVAAHSHSLANVTGINYGGGGSSFDLAIGSYQTAATGTGTGSASPAAASAAHNNTQPTLVANVIVKT